MGGAFGPPSDLFSLGVTLYTAVEGGPPFDQGDPFETMRAVVEEPPRPARLAGPLQPVLLGLLEKDPARRWTRRPGPGGAARAARRARWPLRPRPRQDTDPYAVGPPAATRSAAAAAAPTGQIGGRAMLDPDESAHRAARRGCAGAAEPAPTTATARPAARRPARRTGRAGPRPAARAAPDGAAAPSASAVTMEPARRAPARRPGRPASGVGHARSARPRRQPRSAAGHRRPGWPPCSLVAAVACLHGVALGATAPTTPGDHRRRRPAVDPPRPPAAAPADRRAGVRRPGHRGQRAEGLGAAGSGVLRGLRRPGQRPQGPDQHRERRPATPQRFLEVAENGLQHQAGDCAAPYQRVALTEAHAGRAGRRPSSSTPAATATPSGTASGGRWSATARRTTST